MNVRISIFWPTNKLLKGKPIDDVNAVYEKKAMKLKSEPLNCSKVQPTTQSKFQIGQLLIMRL